MYDFDWEYWLNIYHNLEAEQVPEEKKEEEEEKEPEVKRIYMSKDEIHGKENR